MTETYRIFLLSKVMASANASAPPYDVERAAAQEGSVGGRWWRLEAAAEGKSNNIPPGQQRFIRNWNKIFVASCVFAVLMDPLFFYSLIIDQDKKCIQRDKRLMIAALVFRSLTDVIFTVHFVYQILKVCKAKFTKQPPSTGNNVLPSSVSAAETGGNSGRSIAQKMNSWFPHSMIINFFSLLPIPQLLIVLTFYNSGYLEHQTVLNVFLLGQYLPRICRIHLSSQELRRNTGIWGKSLFNFFLYVLASHILGAFWYFFSIQREISCWLSACEHHSTYPIACMDTFYCEGHPTTIPRNITFLNKHCPLEDTPAPFKFGIFLDSLNNHNSEHIKFGKKFLYSFWWGLRNLSNFGTNLETSTYVGENLFAILISIVGLLLFLYLIGNVQNFMQIEAANSEAIRRKIRMTKLHVDNWISRNGLPDEMKREIIKSMKQKLKENKDADLHDLSFLPWKTRIGLKRCLCMKPLRTVPMLENMNTKVLEMMCDYMKPMKYDENSFVFRMGDPLDRMLFIIEGTMWIYSTGSESQGSMAAEPLENGQFYGEELVEWASAKFTQVPISAKHVKCQTRVDALALMAKDLAIVVNKCQYLWDLNKYCSNPQEVQEMAASTLSTAYRRRLNKRATKSALMSTLAQIDVNSIPKISN